MNLKFEKKFGFEVWDKTKIDKTFVFAEGYRQFLSECKTEREVVSWVTKKINKEGFEVYPEGSSRREIEGFGGPSKKNISKRVFGVNRDQAMVLAVLGQKPVKSGVRMIMAHIDSPRLDLKSQPLYEEEKIAFLKTQYYGGIKKYQWPALPLAIHGVIVLANGKKIVLNVGENETEPVLTISDLLPHLSQKQMEKKLEEAILAEDLNILVGSRPTEDSKLNTKNNEKDLVKLGVLELLNKKYGITEEDLVSADLEIVPAGPARNLGFDESMILGYGQDDRICAYSALSAFLTIKDPVYTTMLVLTDKEETGSEGNTSAISNFIPDFISEMIFKEEGKHDENTLRDCLSQSKAISADVTVAYDPDYPDAFDTKNTARLGAGIAIEKYTGRRGKSDTSEASAEYLAEIRQIFNQNNILWQTGGMGKVDLGGGGTIAMFLARYNLDVIDAGPALLSMHSPFEISSKVDIYASFEAYQSFFSSK